MINIISVPLNYLKDATWIEYLVNIRVPSPITHLLMFAREVIGHFKLSIEDFPESGILSESCY